MGEYITWDDLIKIAMLVIAIIACFRNNNKKDNRPSFQHVRLSL